MNLLFENFFLIYLGKRRQICFHAHATVLHELLLLVHSSRHLIFFVVYSFLIDKKKERAFFYYSFFIYVQ